MNNTLPSWQITPTSKQKKSIVDHYIAALFSVSVLTFAYLVVMIFSIDMTPKPENKKVSAPTFNSATIDNVDEGMFSEKVPSNVSADKINSLFPQIKE